MVPPSSRPPGGKQPQGGGELSGLLRQAEVLHRELEKAHARLQEESVTAQDASEIIRICLAGDGTPREVSIRMEALSEGQRKVLEEALRTALKGGLESLFALRRERLSAVTRGLNLPGSYA